MQGQDVVWRIVERSIYEWLTLAAVLLISIWLIIRIKARYWDHEDPKAAEHEMLLQIGDLRREGQLTDEEYRSIKGRLIERFDDSSQADTTGDESPEHRSLGTDAATGREARTEE